jgi:hypothetical protein
MLNDEVDIGAPAEFRMWVLMRVCGRSFSKNAVKTIG